MTTLAGQAVNLSFRAEGEESQIGNGLGYNITARWVNMHQETLQRLRAGLSGTPYEGKVYLVGGYVRDKLLG
ncbi:MAG: hypothetical protein NZM10_00505, partial [Fimbriimonadales bacterium]|nr:hypothetical protein [Fimbriimonadales bacterium]